MCIVVCTGISVATTSTARALYSQLIGGAPYLLGGALEGVFVMLFYLVFDYICDVGCGTRSILCDNLCLHDKMGSDHSGTPPHNGRPGGQRLYIEVCRARRWSSHK